MVNNKRTELLGHPLCKALVRLEITNFILEALEGTTALPITYFVHTFIGWQTLHPCQSCRSCAVSTIKMRQYCYCLIVINIGNIDFNKFKQRCLHRSIYRCLLIHKSKTFTWLAKTVQEWTGACRRF